MPSSTLQVRSEGDAPITAVIDIDFHYYRGDRGVCFMALSSAQRISAHLSSSNPAMENWHMGDAEQTPRAQVYIVRTRLDAYVKFLIQEHDAGVFTIDWAFSGAGKATF